MPSLDECYPDLVAALAAPGQKPRPASRSATGWEAVVRAALARGPAASRAERAVAALDEAGWLEPADLADATPQEIRDALAGAGIAIPLRPCALLQRLARWYTDAFPDPAAPAGEEGPSTSLLRDRLLAINGVGPGTADAVLLALGRACLPVEPGIYRILVRHGWCDVTADYEEASEALSRHARGDAEAIETLHRELSAVGRRFCGVRTPKCENCPLRGLLPEGEPIDPQG